MRSKLARTVRQRFRKDTPERNGFIERFFSAERNSYSSAARRREFPSPCGAKSYGDGRAGRGQRGGHRQAESSRA